MPEAIANADSELDAAVLIVGCGPVGMTLANLLGVYGVRTLVLERNARLYDHPRAVGSDCDSLRAWQAAGLAEALLEDMTPMGPDGLGMVYQDARGRPFMEVRPQARESGFAFGYGLIQPLVDRVLFDGLARFEHVEVRFGHRVSSVSQDAHGVRVRGRRVDDRPFELRAAFAVACDGGASAVRRQLGIAMRGRSYHRSWLVLDTLELRPQEPACAPRDVQICCDPERPRVSVPRSHGHRRFEFLQRKDESPAELESPEAIRAMIGLFTDPDQIHVTRRVSHVFSARIAERFRVGRILLAGDAAHVTPPFAAQGLASGVRDVFNLAWKLALVTRGGAPESLLRSYETERMAHDRDSVKLAVRLGWIMMPGSRLSALLTQGLLRLLLRVPALRRFVREGGPRPAIRYRKGFVCGGRLRGTTLPQPQVEDWKGKRRKLDELLGRGFALVGFGVIPEHCVSAQDRAFWQRLGTRFLRVLPADEVCERQGDVRDVAGALRGRWGRAWGRCVLVRPDRVIAADAGRSSIAASLRRLERRLVHGSCE